MSMTSLTEFVALGCLDRASVRGKTPDRQRARPSPSEAAGTKGHFKDQQSHRQL